MPRQSFAPAATSDLIERVLEPGESIQWVGTPVARCFSAITRSTLIFGLMWVAFATLWLSQVVFGPQHAVTVRILGGLGFHIDDRGDERIHVAQHATGRSA